MKLSCKYTLNNSNSNYTIFFNLKNKCAFIKTEA